jgi:hypothetical protein
MNRASLHPKQKPIARLLLPVLLLMAVAVASGCTSTGLPGSREPAAIVPDGSTLVLLNVRCTVDRQPRPAFPTVPLVVFGLASFETFGEFASVGWSRLSREPEGEGWVCFRLKPGSYYLRAYGPAAGPQSGQAPASIWRMVVPDAPGPVYAGTLVLSGRSLGRSFPGIETIEPGGAGFATLRDDSGQAAMLAARYLPDWGEMRTVFLQPWKAGDPMIFRSPRSWGRP